MTDPNKFEFFHQIVAIKEATISYKIVSPYKIIYKEFSDILLIISIKINLISNYVSLIACFSATK